ncbi:hypothetical protein [Marinagarivorans algicola]|uniref:hypothetical protein n=1 Tax=Marinagarivorans algicola TaxID=1513270 RepID=UPI0006B51624|nr:hypothetical protein [Marinagarivorans algicola]
MFKLSYWGSLCIAGMALVGCDGAPLPVQNTDATTDIIADNADAYPNDPLCHKASDGNGDTCYWTLIEQQKASVLAVQGQDTAFIYLPLSHQILPFKGSANQFLSPIPIDSSKKPVAVAADESSQVVYAAYSDGSISRITAAQGEQPFANTPINADQLFIHNGLLVVTPIQSANQTLLHPYYFDLSDGSTVLSIPTSTSSTTEAVMPYGQALNGQLLGRAIEGSNLYAITLELEGSASSEQVKYTQHTLYPRITKPVSTATAPPPDVSAPLSSPDDTHTAKRYVLTWPKLQWGKSSQDGLMLAAQSFYRQANTQAAIVPMLDKPVVDVVWTPSDQMLVVKASDQKTIIERWSTDFVYLGTREFDGRYLKLLGADEQYTVLTNTELTGLTSHAFTGSQTTPAVNKSPIALAPPLSHVTAAIEIDKNGLVYVIGTDQQVIHRWSATEKAYIEPIVFEPNWLGTFRKAWSEVTYAAHQNTFYFRADQKPILNDYYIEGYEYTRVAIDSAANTLQQEYLSAGDLSHDNQRFQILPVADYLLMNTQLYDYEGQLYSKLAFPPGLFAYATGSYLFDNTPAVIDSSQEHLFYRHANGPITVFKQDAKTAELHIAKNLAFKADNKNQEPWPLFLTPSSELIATRTGDIYRLGDLDIEPAAAPTIEPSDDFIVIPPRPSLGAELTTLVSQHKVAPFHNAVWLPNNELVTIVTAANSCELHHYDTDFNALKSQVIEGSCVDIVHSDIASPSGGAQPVVVVTAIDRQLVFTVY